MKATFAGLDRTGREVHAGGKYGTREIGMRREVQADTEGNNITILPTASPTAPRDTARDVCSCLWEGQ